MKFEDIIGSVFGKLTVVALQGRDKWGNIVWNCLCDCGTPTTVNTGSLKSGHKKSCGCLHKDRMREINTIHGLSRSTTYRSWQHCNGRCYNPKMAGYKDYGGAGITVCDRWREPAPQGFLNFLEDMGERPKGHTLNRVKGARVYSKETCEWASLSLQSFDQKLSSNNRSGISGVYWSKNNNKWQVTLGVDGVRVDLGRTLDIDVAREWRRAAELKYYGFYKTPEKEVKDEV